jgi:hypothetical protein
MKHAKTLLIMSMFLLGLYIFSKGNVSEGFTNDSNYRCPNILIQKGTDFFLYNSNLAKVPGVNPLQFNSLEEYKEFMDWQRSQGIRCPILYLQESYDAQGNPVYAARPSPTNLQGGNQMISAPLTKLFDASHSDSPYNVNSYPGFDPLDQYVGLKTPLDQMYHEAGDVSANPMDANWAGKDYTQSLVDRGYYAEDEVLMPQAE